MSVEKRLDSLYPKLRINRRCQVCGRPSEHIHHLIHRSNLLLRYDLKNLVPLCSDCHRRVHDNGLKIFTPYAEYLNALKNVDFKQYLLERGLTKEEFFKIKERELKENIYDNF